MIQLYSMGCDLYDIIGQQLLSKQKELRNRIRQNKLLYQKRENIRKMKKINAFSRFYDQKIQTANYYR